jgi:hypothetical protein
MARSKFLGCKWGSGCVIHQVVALRACSAKGLPVLLPEHIYAVVVLVVAVALRIQHYMESDSTASANLQREMLQYLGSCDSDCSSDLGVATRSQIGF